MKKFFLEEINKKCGFACYHSHFDKAYLMTPECLRIVNYLFKKSGNYIRQQVRHMKKLNVNVIVCPNAAISMKQDNSAYAPVHNSIAPVSILLEEGVNVKLGMDNIEDLFMSIFDGDMWFEARLLMKATRIYQFNKIINIFS